MLSLVCKNCGFQQEQEARTEYLRLKSRKHIKDAGESSKQLNEGKAEEHGESAVSTYGAGALSDDIYSGKHINFFKETDGVRSNFRRIFWNLENF